MRPTRRHQSCSAASLLLSTILYTWSGFSRLSSLARLISQKYVIPKVCQLYILQAAVRQERPSRNSLSCFAQFCRSAKASQLFLWGDLSDKVCML